MMSHFYLEFDSECNPQVYCSLYFFYLIYNDFFKELDNLIFSFIFYIFFHNYFQTKFACVTQVFVLLMLFLLTVVKNVTFCLSISDHDPLR